MAANLEEIFQSFILHKIKEIEDQDEDKSTAVGESHAGETDKPSESSKVKKHKKQKKHKSKKKKRSREADSSASRETPTESTKQQDGDHKKDRRHHSSGKKKKKKKKKRKRKDDELSSDSDTARKTDSVTTRSLSEGRQEELPDIIPKQVKPNEPQRSKQANQQLRALRCCATLTQDSTSKGRGTEDSHGCSPSHFHTRLHSCTVKEKPESLSGSQAIFRCPPTSSSPSKKAPTPDDPAPCPSEPLQPTFPQRQQEVAEEQSETDKLESDALPSATSKPERVAERKPTKDSLTDKKSPAKRTRRLSRSPHRSKERRPLTRAKSSRSPHRSHRRRSRSRSPSHRKRSRSRSRSRGHKYRRSRSRSRSRIRSVYSQRDRWKREPSHSPVLVLRKKRSPARKVPSTSPQRVSDLDKEQLLEIAKANAAAMCAKAGMPVPACLRSSMLPLTLPNLAMNAAMASMTAATVTAALSNIGALSSLLPLPCIVNKPPSNPSQAHMAALEEVKKKVEKQANSISIKEFTEKCKMIVDSTGELPVAAPHVSDDEDDGKPFGGSTLREQKAINFSIINTMIRPGVRSDADRAKEFPVSSGSQHRKKEGEGQAAYGEWVLVEALEKPAATSKKASTSVPLATATVSLGEPAAGSSEATKQPALVTDSDSVFPEPPLQPVDITQAVTERIKAQRRLAENPYDISAICMLSRAQEQVDAWAQSNTVPGLFTGSTGAQVLSSEELSNSGPQAWLKKDQFLRAAPVSGGMGEFLMRKMGWRTGEGLGRNREGTVEPIVIDFKVDRKGLVAEGEKPQKQTGGLVVTKDLMGKHPVSALIELCNKKRIMQPDFIMVHHSGPDHRKNFLFKVTVNGVDYQPQTASPNKKHAKAMAATVALQALGEVPVDGPGLYTGPVFTAASTGPLFST
ncbi:protein SON isoform X2 [Gouania willdenowi]|uniref:protein SON isoform X2 n=1 Tax=Gouania willdenowi TaxID=441366 RepID=UPI001054D951|nr:protein SON-like isoform X2 [Gouania willdenowi]